MGIFLQELTSLNSTVKPLLFLLNFIVQHSEHPDFTTLKPNEFVCIENAAITIKTAEISAILEILRFLKPKRKNIIKELVLILLRQFLEVHNSFIKSHANI